MADTLWSALLAAQGTIGALAKDAQGKGYRYASLPAVLAEIRPALYAHGLALTGTARIIDAGLVEVDTIIVHIATGERHTCTVAVPPAAVSTRDGRAVLSGPQEIGSSISYARRYGLLLALGLPADDSDAAPPAETAAQRAVASPPARTPADERHLARAAALAAIGQRQGIQAPEMADRLRELASGGMQLGADHAERSAIGALLEGDHKAWRRLSDADFSRLLAVLDRWGASIIEQDLPL